MASNEPKNSLDHLILFLPVDAETNLPKIPSFISDNFTLTPGGIHADGLTSSMLTSLTCSSLYFLFGAFYFKCCFHKWHRTVFTPFRPLLFEAHFYFASTIYSIHCPHLENPLRPLHSLHPPGSCKNLHH